MNSGKRPMWPVMVRWSLMALAVFVILPGPDWKELGVSLCAIGMLIHMNERRAANEEIRPQAVKVSAEKSRDGA